MIFHARMTMAASKYKLRNLTYVITQCRVLILYLYYTSLMFTQLLIQYESGEADIILQGSLQPTSSLCSHEMLRNFLHLKYRKTNNGSVNNKMG